MSILITGMKMPKGNDELRLIIRSNGQVIISHETYYEETEAVPVPPHGRLIDADALDTSILQAGFSYAITRRKLRYTPGEVRQKIANAPTVIPAEEGET